MTKTAWVLIVIVIVLGIGYWLMKSKYSTTTTTPATTTTPTTPTTTTPTASNAVSIIGMAFSPKALTVTKGTTVTWTNNDTVSHTVVESDSKTGPASKTLAPGGTYSFAFDTVDTFSYHCTIHSSMTGTVTVTE